MTEGERRMFDALPRRHTHRNGYVPDPLPQGLLIGLQHDAVAEQAALPLIDRPAAFTQLAGIVAWAAVLGTDPLGARIRLLPARSLRHR